MFKIKILTPKKTKEQWLDDALSEYIKRLTPTMQLEFIFCRDDLHLLQLCEKEPYIIALDPKGVCLTSEAFTTFFYNHIKEAGSRLTFIIGGPNGLPNELKHVRAYLSLSPMTFTHQMSRLILVEQLYRAVEIEKGSSYHK